MLECVTFGLAYGDGSREARLEHPQVVVDPVVRGRDQLACVLQEDRGRDHVGFQELDLDLLGKKGWLLCKLSV